MRDLTTIVMLTYNGEKYIEDMLDSILHQTYRPIQLIISDDASADKTIDIIKGWIKKHVHSPNFEIVFNKQKSNIGRSGNRESTLQFIKGAYVFLADQDDIWEAAKIEQQVNFLEKNQDCVGVSCDRSIISETGNLYIKSEEVYRGYIHKDIINFESALNRLYNYPANCIGFRNIDLNKIFSIPENMKEPDLFLRMMIASLGKIGFIHIPLVKYRIHDNNLSSNYYIEMSKSVFDVFKKSMDIISRKNAICELDDTILANELKKRFSIDLRDFNYIWRKKRRSILLRSLKATFIAHKNKKINFFNS